MRFSRLLVTLTALTITAPAIAAAPIIWGANGHPLTAYPGITIQQQLDLVKGAGLTSYRIGVSDSASSMKLVDTYVTEAKARGITLLPVIAMGVTASKTPDQLYADAYSRATTLGAHFKGQFPVWELGNELENYAIIQPCEKRDDGTTYPCAWGPAGGVGPLEYYGPRWKQVSAILRGLSDGMRKTDPAAKQAMGTAGWGHIGAFERMKNDGLKWDISVWHWYTSSTTSTSFTYFPKLATYGKPIWITEFNAANGNKGTAAGDAAQSVILAAAIASIKQQAPLYNIQAAQVYEILDEPYWTGGESTMGLVSMVKVGTKWTVGAVHSAYNTVKTAVGTSTATDLSKLVWKAVAGQGKPTYSVTSNSITLTGNTWVTAAYVTPITAKTVLDFDVTIEATVPGKAVEIYGLALGVNNTTLLPAKTTFELAGSQKWGTDGYSAAPGKTTHLSIPIGKLSVGNSTSLTLVADADKYQNANIQFSNFSFHEVQ